MRPSRSITESSYSWLMVMASTGQTCEQSPQKRQRPERRMNSPSSRSPSSEGTTCISRQEVGQMRAQSPQATQRASPVSGSARNEGSPRFRGAAFRFSSGYSIVTFGLKSRLNVTWNPLTSSNTSDLQFHRDYAGEPAGARSGVNLLAPPSAGERIGVPTSMYDVVG